jgi:hypothetical protein
MMCVQKMVLFLRKNKRYIISSIPAVLIIISTIYQANWLLRAECQRAKAFHIRLQMIRAVKSHMWL